MGTETLPAPGSLSGEGRSVSTYTGTIVRDRDSWTAATGGSYRLRLEQCLELLIGPRDSLSAFASDQFRRIMWQAHSAELLRLVEPGSRPWAWWQYEAPEPARPRESELAYLIRCGLLTAADRRRLSPADLQRESQATRNP